MPAVGSRIAGYVLEEEIGAGGMAVVFRARDERLGRPVALKVLAPGLAADGEFRRRFLRESRAAAAVDDPHIIPVYEAGQAGGVLFLAMRYVSGGDVRGLLRRQGPLPPGRAAAIISPVACALDAAHGAGLVHRDVKPANMLIDARPGRPDHVYLSDFGLARGGAASALTGTGLMLGTAAYMAPEQIQGQAVDGRADQYALGCTAFELLAGGVPFERDQDMAVIYAHVSVEPPPLSARRAGLAPGVDEVLGRALAKAPGDRYASCGEFAEALRQALGLPGYDRDPASVPAQAAAAARSAPGAPGAAAGATVTGPAGAQFEEAARGRATAAATPAAPGPVIVKPTNLPAQLARFIGRARELAEVRALVESCRLVTLTGTGGSGKTRLSLQVAAELLDGSGDGVWLVELAAMMDEDAVAPAICGALGIAAQPGRAVLDTLLDALSLQDVLIVLDNCEHLIGGCAKTAEAIVRRCPGVHLVATSREPLGIGGEALYRVPPLSLPGPGDCDLAAAESSDAVALFTDRARGQGTSLSVDETTAPLVVSICRQLDGLPLAIELAAARLRSLSLRGLADRLDQRFRLLTGGSRTAAARQQTLRATVEWSYSLLNGAEQLLLGRLSVFAETFDLDAAEAVCGAGDLDVFDVADLLGSLVDKSLVVAEPAGETLRYRLLETIRQFAAEQLAQAGQEETAAVAAAHCAHYLSVAEAAAPHLTGPGQGGWYARLDADQANLRRAAGHAAGEAEGTTQVLRFGAALMRYWMARSRDQEALALLLPVLDRPGAQADPKLFGTALLTAAIAARRLDIPIARRRAEQAVTLARQLHADPLLIESLATLSAICYYAGEPEQGLPHGREAVQRARQLGDDVLLGVSLVLYLMYDPVTGPAYAERLTEAIACTQRSGDQFFSYFAHSHAGFYALRAGDIPAARAHLQQAAQAMRAIGADFPDLPINMGWVLRQDNDPDGARSSFLAGLRMSRRSGVRVGIAYAGLGLACLAADTGNWHQAAVLHGVAQTFLDPTGQPWDELEARYRRDSLDKVRAHLGQDQFERAHAQGMALGLEEALDLASGKASPT